MEEEFCIYLYGDKELPESRYAIEDELIERLDDFGLVSGTGSGGTKWNLDIAFWSLDNLDRVLSVIVNLMREIGVEENIVFDINGTTSNLENVAADLEKK